ncbi:MAG: hypothetical protein Kow00109_19310 [Acidobacteriota bacterium]
MRRKRWIRASILVLVFLAVTSLGQWRRGRSSSVAVQSLPADPQEERILNVLRRMRDEGATYLSVPDADGRLLRILVEAVNARNVLEIGTSTGYSGLWISLGLQSTGGRLTTLEYDSGRAAAARRHFGEAGVGEMVNVIIGDAHDTVLQLEGPFDVVFIDADKSGYLDYLRKVLPKVRPGGLILAHNYGSAPDYVRAVTTDPSLETTFFDEGNGMSITLKKR